MTKTKHFPTFTLHNSHMPNSKPLDQLTDAEVCKLIDWTDKDEIVYRKPTVKLKSIITREGVDLDSSPFPYYGGNLERLFDKPHIEIK